MTSLAEHLIELNRNDEHPHSLRERLVIQAALRRVSASRACQQLVLRGGTLTQFWVGARRRATKDLDFLALFPRDLADATDQILEILATPVAEDGVLFFAETLSAEIIWQETAFPGIRLLVEGKLSGEAFSLQIDLGFDDPLVPPAEWLDYPCLLGDSCRLQVARPELLTAWKLDGLLDHGLKRWQAKDLYDLYLLTSFRQLESSTLREATLVALRTHGNCVDDLITLLYDPQWWQSAAARQRWEKFRQNCLVEVPEDLLGVATSVAEALRPMLLG